MQVFAPEVTFALCPECGASIQLAAGVARASCDHCRAPLHVKMRLGAAAVAADRAESTAAASQFELSTQDPRWLPPAELFGLLAGNRVAPGLQGNAEAYWHQLVGAMSAHGDHDPATAERLFFLTAALAEELMSDPRRQRAMMDTALSLLTSPLHQQVLQAQLARAACRAGDPQAAASWLAHCDPKPGELHADTAYRYARAYLATAHGDFRAVVSSLSCPYRSDLHDTECIVLLANAWERLGQQSAAVDLLLGVWYAGGPLARARARRMIASHSTWQLCPSSADLARQRAQALVPQPQNTVSGQAILVALGSTALVWTVLSILGMALGLAGALGHDLGLGGYLLSCMTGLILGGLLLPLALSSRKRSRHRERVKKTEGHTAQILGARTAPHSSSEADVLQVTLDLLILPDDAAAYRITKEVNIFAETAERFAVGRQLVARIDPTNRHDPVLLSVD